MTFDPTTLSPAQQELFNRYDEAALQTVIGVVGPHFLDRIADLDAIDPEWAANFLQFVSSVHKRTVLDPKTRALVSVGEVVVLGNELGLTLHATNALNAGATEEEIAEVILQTCIFTGFPPAHRALKVFRKLQESRRAG
jgi:4-carboxymuconolactone decarboxylase